MNKLHNDDVVSGLNSTRIRQKQMSWKSVEGKSNFFEKQTKKFCTAI